MCSKLLVLIYWIVISMIRDTQRPLWSSRAPVVPWKLVPAGTVVSWERCRHNFSKVSGAQNCWHNSNLRTTFFKEIFCGLVESYPHKMDSVTLVCLSLLCLWRKTEQRKENEDTNDVTELRREKLKSKAKEILCFLFSSCFRKVKQFDLMVLLAPQVLLEYGLPEIFNHPTSHPRKAFEHLSLLYKSI